MLEKVWRKGNPPTLLVGMRIGAATMVDIRRFLKKTKYRTTISSSNPTPGHLPRENHNSTRYIHTCVHSSTIHHRQDMDTKQMSIHRGVAREDVVQLSLLQPALKPQQPKWSLIPSWLQTEAWTAKGISMHLPTFTGRLCLLTLFPKSWDRRAVFDPRPSERVMEWRLYEATSKGSRLAKESRFTGRNMSSTLNECSGMRLMAWRPRWAFIPARWLSWH